MSANIAEEKRALREVIRVRRRGLSLEERAVRARAAADHLLSVPAIRQAGTVLLFYAFGEEPATRAVSERLRELGEFL